MSQSPTDPRFELLRQELMADVAPVRGFRPQRLGAWLVALGATTLITGYLDFWLPYW